MDIELVLATFVSTAVGIAAGRWYERKRAIRAINNISMQAAEAMNALANAGIALAKMGHADTPLEELAKKFMEMAKERGFEGEAMSREEAAKRGLINGE